MNRITAFCLWALPLIIVAQPPEVPHKMVVAGITLTIRDDARREIQEDVNALTRSARHFEIKAQRARTYFPIIEQILREERVPDDFKYLVLQESALIPDAVSVSNAVGYWQFKDFTALEMGLRVDEHVDERMNIVSSTRAAARYLKKNNYYFNNWIYALQAYQMGAGAVMRSVKDYESGSRHMEITSSTYWYVKKFLAHKVAFEQAVQGPAELKLVTLSVQQQKTLSDIAREMQINESDLLAYNVWARKNTIPDDKPYVVVVPVVGNAPAATPLLAAAQSVATDKDTSVNRSVRNGIPVIKADENDSWATLASKAGISLRKLLRYNDCAISDRVVAGSFYYIQPKKRKTESAAYHVARQGESLWMISQQYGISLKKVRKLNPGVSDQPTAGATIYFVRTENTGTRTTDVVQLDTNDAFSWATDQPTVMVSAGLNTRPVDDSPKPVVVHATTNKASTPADMHRVEAGETLYSISRKYSIAINDLLSANQLKPGDPIKPGQWLKIPSPSTQPSNLPAVEDARLSASAPNQVTGSENTTGTNAANTPSGFKLYEVKPADTLYSIARQHGVTIKELMEWNGKKDFSVTPGEKLKIAQR
ncbi:MAG: LysM peptidoglycan-binding domain-containing protein [Cyclobacteriaceae bacterium]|nr:LysM peptidoglycan-binding domain-containing protein [Cyclobacteriaceae bacterium]MDW8331549.1 LysM peptidoglycan-binding domain-containing protein [Cyclobacteriaceae bacterium]